MADPRFYDNRGPFTLAEVCTRLLVAIPDHARCTDLIGDVAGLEGAASSHLTFCAGEGHEALAATRAGWCLINRDRHVPAAVAPCLIACDSVQGAFAAAAALFYPEHGLGTWDQSEAVHPSAKLDENVRLAPGVVIGPGAEIGAGTRVGPNAMIGHGVMIGRDCEIGAHAGIAFAYIGDRAQILPGAQIGQPGFGFAASPEGHVKVPQLGRVIVQDRVEIGAGTTIDRGALGDTVIGEGTKIDNLVQIGHNSRIGRHCVIVAQTGISGSCELGDFVVLGGQAGIADHARIGAHARFAARAAAAPREYPGGEDYGGVPARPMKEWRRELAAIALLAKRGRRKRE
ncbi:MAG TPA: UDP-3-O-(3-hydroxymyristoyl)glucosamine N-acyltransferase [Rhizomicrobium sp.]|jgi:UDP-3-O-[3-hydroxymyristoyl] glucosamine N-acyltransferase|nr:UDP-3-O-(3-hydroxymyristoyl)glucosamine N-acyltransferase [Rhizomicrobium sp.]